jgi:colanic acid/amylovoran biosynthesis protein
MTDVIIRGLPTLDNYGTAMMGLVTIQHFADRLPGPLRLHPDLYRAADADEIFSELNVDPGRVSINRYVRRPAPPAASPKGLFHRLKKVLGHPDTAEADLTVVLGGDDLSEYYGSRAWRHLLTYWVTAQASPVVLLGQTIGPFEMPKNRLAARFLMPSLTVVARDRWTTSYLQSEFGLGDRLVQGSDLAWADLPLQHRQDIEADILNRFGLLPDSYATIVISGMQGAGYYTPDRGLYLQRWKETVEGLLDLPQMAGRRICLLAHTYGIYGDESRNVVDVFSLLSEEARQRVVPVPDRILPTRARFILGNGLFTISGRMHPAVSTFQMGKPAIALAYSKKYNGVIGTMIGRGDLILDANDPALWSSGEIVSAMLALAADVLARHQTLCTEIRQAVAVQKGIVKTSLDNAVAMVKAI